MRKAETLERGVFRAYSANGEGGCALVFYLRVTCWWQAFISALPPRWNLARLQDKEKGARFGS